MSASTPGPTRGIAWYLRKVREKGWKGVFRHFALRVPPWEQKLFDKYVDWKLGISTAGEISSVALGHDHPEWHDYAPSYYMSLRRILAGLKFRGGDDVLVDFGSGLGRVLVYAAAYPVKRIIGVEYSEALNRAARDNLERARGRMKCRDVDVVTADAARYSIPDDATLLYFGNPFVGGVLAAVLDNTRASLMRSPRRIYLVSHSHEPTYPFEQQIRRCPWLRMDTEIKLHRGYRAWIYTNTEWTQ